VIKIKQMKSMEEEKKKISRASGGEKYVNFTLTVKGA
jgi:hypothetical protein